VDPEPLYRLLEEAVIRDRPRMWRVTWRNRETGNTVRRILTRDEFEASLAENRPAEKPLWSRDEIDAIGTPRFPID
jgi:hypothetical protein